MNKDLLNEYLVNNTNGADRYLLYNSFIASKLFPINYNNNPYILSDSSDSDAIVVDNEFYPQDTLRENYGNYIDSGDKAAKSIQNILLDYNLSNPKILDWGCAAGRVIRWIPKYMQCQLYGCDINCNYINWCQKYINHIGSFSQCTTFPHLPYADNSFDCVYGLSVFTHINQLIDMWLLELHRILKPSGILLITMHDDDAYKIITKHANDDNHPGSAIAGLIKESFNDTLPDIYTFDRMSCGFNDPRGNFMFFSNKNIDKTFGKIFKIDRKLSTNNPSDYETAFNLGYFQTTYVLIKK
jgi:SAM-dependent methyltransferase